MSCDIFFRWKMSCNNNGSGSIGLQLARVFGARSLVTTTSSKNAAYCTSLGATRVIDYHTENWWEVLPSDSFDVIYDTVGQEGTADRAMQKLRRGGSFVTIAGALSQHPKPGVSQNFFINSDTNLSNLKELNALKGLVEDFNLTMHIDGQFNLSRVEEAFDMSAQGHVVGKISVAVSLQ
mmetsp:Transcript_25785/g.41679  ORF Transcript_25785/g.41679 Transcript_25785/m.41679 type:complete len:179 (+) Transcript_25785:825-1361(+)